MSANIILREVWKPRTSLRKTEFLFLFTPWKWASIDGEFIRKVAVMSTIKLSSHKQKRITFSQGPKEGWIRFLLCGERNWVTWSALLIFDCAQEMEEHWRKLPWTSWWSERREERQLRDKSLPCSFIKPKKNLLSSLFRTLHIVRSPPLMSSWHCRFELIRK